MTVEPKTQFTLEDYRYLPEDGKRHEIIGGEHIVTPAPIPRHQFVVNTLQEILGPPRATIWAGSSPLPST